MFDFHSYKQKYSYPSRRILVYGSRGMVCTASHLAAQAGLDMLKELGRIRFLPARGGAGLKRYRK